MTKDNGKVCDTCTKHSRRKCRHWGLLNPTRSHEEYCESWAGQCSGCKVIFEDDDLDCFIDCKVCKKRFCADSDCFNRDVRKCTGCNDSGRFGW